MRNFRAVRKDRKEEIHNAYTVEEFEELNIVFETPIVKGSKKKQRLYNPDFMTFDIETSSYNDGDSIRGFMYIWQVCYKGVCIYGRKWEEFHNLLDYIFAKSEAHTIIYVHNLGFEYEFMFRFLHAWYGDLDVFSVKTRKPLVVRIPGKFEFRCSWKLSNMSLEKFALNEYNNPYLKAVGDLDYKVLRWPDTEITDEEFGYSMNDVLCQYHAILHKMINEDDDILSIPLTSTGYVRRDFRKVCMSDVKYKEFYKQQTLTKEVYTLLKETGRGGDTSANFRMSGELVDDVLSSDVASSYPYQLVTQKFPVRKFYRYGDTVTEEEMDVLSESRPLLFRVAFKGLKMRWDCIDVYLPLSKAIYKSKTEKVCNGRVMYSDAIVYTLTDIDWKLVKRCYTWDEVTITDVYWSKYGYLPKIITDKIMSYFQEKCELKFKIDTLRDVGKDETDPELANLLYLYAKSKNRLNGIFGMMYTDPVRDDIITDFEDTGEWKTGKADIKESLDKINRYSNNFLVYAWGVWTTAHARNHLQNLIQLVGTSSIYWDTDSDKFPYDESIVAKIETENEKIKEICRERGACATVNGKTYYLGIYEIEDRYQNFKTLGAKKYAYTDQKGKLHLAVSGVAKSPDNMLHPDGAREMGDIDKFNIGYTFREAGGLTLHYNDDKIHTLASPNGLQFLCGANVGTEDSTYTIGITEEYAEVLCMSQEELLFW